LSLHVTCAVDSSQAAAKKLAQGRLEDERFVRVRRVEVETVMVAQNGKKCCLQGKTSEEKEFFPFAADTKKETKRKK
jgi:hypothetical protein